MRHAPRRPSLVLSLAAFSALVIGLVAGCGSSTGPTAGEEWIPPQLRPPKPDVDYAASLDAALEEGGISALRPGVPGGRLLGEGEWQWFRLKAEAASSAGDHFISVRPLEGHSDVDLYVMGMDASGEARLLGASVLFDQRIDWVHLPASIPSDGDEVYCGALGHNPSEPDRNLYLIQYDALLDLPPGGGRVDGGSAAWKDDVWYTFGAEGGRHHEVALDAVTSITDVHVYLGDSSGIAGWSAWPEGGGRVRFWAEEDVEAFVRVETRSPPSAFTVNRSALAPRTPPPVTDPADRVILLAWDGCQRQHLHESLAAGELPHLAQLVANGGLVDLEVRNHPTGTKAGFAEMLTGHTPSVTGVCHGTEFRGAIPPGLTLFERLERGIDDLTTCFVSGKDPKFLGGSTPGELWHNAAPRIDEYLGDLPRDVPVGGPLMTDFLARHGGAGPFFAFFHFKDPDKKGHTFGENSSYYDASISECDTWLGRIDETLRGLGIRDQTCVLVTTDHGFREDEHHHRRAPDAWLAADRADLVHDGGLEDIAPTIYHIMGVPIDDFDPALAGQSLLAP